MPAERKKVVPLLRDKFKIYWSGCPVYYNVYAKWLQKAAYHLIRRLDHSPVTGWHTGDKNHLDYPTQPPGSYHR